jgi:radical SAM superfamily enzyme YgiQ (UPF0313 family)
MEPIRDYARALRGCTDQLWVTGFHGTVEPAAILELTDADLVLRGEPEDTIRDLGIGKPHEEIAGLSYRRDGNVVLNPDRKPVDMKSLPTPAFHLVDPKKYQYEVLGERFMVMEGVRGCPYPCTYCSRVIQGKPLRRKTVEQLGREVEAAVASGVRSIYFIDLEFTAAPDVAEGISKYIISKRIKVDWCCQTRTDKINRSLLELMKKAGCRLIHFGVETGSERIAERVKKLVTVEEQRSGVKLAQDVGIETLCFFLLGHPDETDAEMHQTIRFAKELNPTYASFHRIAPYHGTPLHAEYAKADGTLFPHSILNGDKGEQVDRLVKQAIWSYYTRPRYIVERLFRGRPESLVRQLKLFVGYFAG